MDQVKSVGEVAPSSPPTSPHHVVAHTYPTVPFSATSATAGQNRQPGQGFAQGPVQQIPLRCPRCHSYDTKFGYYNNYNRAQPRHLCKACRRFWTHGGVVRYVPLGGRTKKQLRVASTEGTQAPMSPVLHPVDSDEAIKSPPTDVSESAPATPQPPLQPVASAVSLKSPTTSLSNMPTLHQRHSTWSSLEPIRQVAGQVAETQAPLRCPRCNSSNTKFCYFNNYNINQPRHFCKTCRRYWTQGGLLRNVPVGGSCRKPRPKRGVKRQMPSFNGVGRGMPLFGLGFEFGLDGGWPGPWPSSHNDAADQIVALLQRTGGVQSVNADGAVVSHPGLSGAANQTVVHGISSTGHDDDAGLLHISWEQRPLLAADGQTGVLSSIGIEPSAASTPPTDEMITNADQQALVTSATTGRAGQNYDGAGLGSMAVTCTTVPPCLPPYSPAFSTALSRIEGAAVLKEARSMPAPTVQYLSSQATAMIPDWPMLPTPNDVFP